MLSPILSVPNEIEQWDRLLSPASPSVVRGLRLFDVAEASPPVAQEVEREEPADEHIRPVVKRFDQAPHLKSEGWLTGA